MHSGASTNRADLRIQNDKNPQIGANQTVYSCVGHHCSAKRTVSQPPQLQQPRASSWPDADKHGDNAFTTNGSLPNRAQDPGSADRSSKPAHQTKWNNNSIKRTVPGKLTQLRARVLSVAVYSTVARVSGMTTRRGVKRPRLRRTLGVAEGTHAQEYCFAICQLRQFSC